MKKSASALLTMGVAPGDQNLNRDEPIRAPTAGVETADGPDPAVRSAVVSQS